MSSILLSDLVRYGLERPLGTQIVGCGRIRITDVVACTLPIIDADCEHRTLKTRIRKFLAEAYPSLVEDDACCHVLRRCVRFVYLRCERISYGRTSVKQICKFSWKEWVLVRRSVGEQQDETPRMITRSCPLLPFLIAA